jgi:hypothetical protein
MKSDERMAKVEIEVKNLKEIVVRIEEKIDKAIESKADKSDLKILDSRFWGLVIGMLMLLLGIIAAWFK